MVYEQPFLKTLNQFVDFLRTGKLKTGSSFMLETLTYEKKQLKLNF